MKPEQRRRLIREWRGVDEDPSERRSASQLGDVLPSVMKKLGLKDRYDEEEIGRAWADIVGYPLCVEAVPTGFRNGVVQVRVMQATARYAMELDRKRVLAELQKRFGSRIRDVRLMRS